MEVIIWIFYQVLADFGRKSNVDNGVKPGVKAGLGDGKSDQQKMGDKIKASHIYLGKIHPF
jgi:hypothetical protein